MKYAFGTDINGENLTGIVNLKTMKVLCLCPKENSELILKGLDILEVDGSKINAAHEMYEALEMAYNEFYNPDANIWSEINVLKQVKQVLEKARGEQTTQP